MGQNLSSRTDTDVHTAVLTQEQAVTYLNQLITEKNVSSQYQTGECKWGGDDVSGELVVMGGLDDITKDYDMTVSSKTKRDMIKKLSDGISKALKVSAPSSSASNDEMVAHLLKIVPNPRKGKSIVADKQKQGKLCEDVADVINKAYGNVIDKSLGPDGICNQVSDIVESLSAGLNKEYVAVAASVARALQNLNELKELLSRSYSKLHQEVMNSSDSSLRLKAEGIESVHELIMNEVHRQLSILTNLTNTNLRSVDRDLVELLAENKDFKGLVSSIKSSLGTSEWGDKLGFWLSGVNNVAQMASAVDKALKQIGMKASSYKNASKLSELTMATHKLMESMPADKLTNEYIDKYEKAVEVLKKYHGHHSDIAPKVKGANEYFVGSSSYSDDSSKSAEEIEGGRVRLKEKLNNQQRTRILLIKDFKEKMKIIMDRVYQSIFNVGRRIGEGKVVLSDGLYRFKVVLEDLTLIFQEGIEYALTGYYTHANAVEHKDRFIGLLNSMLHVVEELKDSDESFREIASNIEAVFKLIDFYNDRFRVHVSNVTSERTGQGEGYVNGAYDGGGEFKAVVTLKNAKNMFSHFYNVAKFKHNLKVSSTEMKNYVKDYTTTVGSAVGKEIDRIRTEAKEVLDDCKNDQKDYAKGIKVLISGSARTDIGLDHVSSNGLGGIGTSEWSYENIESLIQCQVNAKIKLYKVAQAVDEYLQKFTNAVATAPEDIQEVSKLLGSVEIMANWFNEKSGDSIASLYEVFPWTQVGMRTYMNKKLQEKTCGTGISTTVVKTSLSGSTHYLKEVVDTTADTIKANDLPDYDNVKDTGGQPGVPFHPISPGRALFAHKFAKYAVDKVYVLKNIISAFAYLGKKFGGEDLTKATFMSPNDMYKHLSEYLYCSAFTTGYASNDPRLYGYKDNIRNPYIPPITYITTGAYSVGTYSGYDSDAAKPNDRVWQFGPYGTEEQVTKTDDAKNGGTLHTDLDPTEYGKGNHFKGNTPDSYLRPALHVKKRFSTVMSSIEDEETNKPDECLNGYTSVFHREDKIFVAIIKAMAAKVFTVTGLYNMLNYGDGAKSYSLSPTRLIMGGGKQGGNSYTYQTPQIYEDAVELYARLPLLAEFYRSVFCYDADCDDQPGTVAGQDEPLLISLVPEVGSMWAGFIQTIFEQPTTTEGLYTENTVRRLIHEINNVYQAFKGEGKDVASLAIADFVAEINSRYGLMNRKEIKEYQDEEKTRRSATTYPESSNYGEDPEDFDILDSDNMGTGVAPSDRYTTIGPYTDSKHKLDHNMVLALKIFRRRIDNRIQKFALKGSTNSTDRGYDRNSFENVPEFGRIIISVKNSLKSIEDPVERFKAVSTMMTNMDASTQTNKEAALMFHESVIAPLGVLTTITGMLQNYQEEVDKWNAPALWRALKKALTPQDPFDNNGTSCWGDNDNSWYDKNAFGQDGTLKTPNNLQKRALEPELRKQNKEGLSGVILTNLFRHSNEVFRVNFMNKAAEEDVDTYTNKFRDNKIFHDVPQRDPNNGWEPPSGWGFKNHVAYCIIRWESLFKRLVTLVTGLTADLGSMCEVSVSNNKLMVNHSKLQVVCEEVFATVRKNMDKFRGIIPTSKIAEYERVGAEGSIGWLQLNLFDNLFNDADRSSGLKRSHHIVTESFMLLTNKDPDNLSHQCTYFDLSDPPANLTRSDTSPMTQGWCVNGVMSEFTHYNSLTMSRNHDPNSPDTGINALAFGTDGILRDGSKGVGGVAYTDVIRRRYPLKNFAAPGVSLEGVLTGDDPFSHLMQSLGPDQKTRSIQAEFAARHDYYLQNTDSVTHAGFRGDTHLDDNKHRLDHNENKEVIDPNTDTNKVDVGLGLMIRFNEVMAQYISQFWDPTALKIYSPLIETPSNGVMNQEVFKAKGWPDLVYGITASDRDLVQNMINTLLGMYNDPANANDIAARVYLGLIGNLTSRSTPVTGFTGLMLDFDLNTQTVGGSTVFQAGSVEVYCTLVKHMLGSAATVAAAVPGTTANEMFALASRAVNQFDAAVAGLPGPYVKDLFENDSKTAHNAWKTRVAQLANSIYSNKNNENGRQLIGKQYTSVELDRIQEALYCLQKGAWPKSGRTWQECYDQITGAAAGTDNAWVVDVKDATSSRAWNYDGPKSVMKAVYRKSAAVNTNVVNTLMRGSLNNIRWVDNSGAGWQNFAGTGGAPPIDPAEFTAALVELNNLLEKGCAGVNTDEAYARLGFVQTSHLSMSDELFTGELQKRLISLRRDFVKACSSVNPITDASWRQTLTAILDTLKYNEVEKFKEKEKDRLTRLLKISGIRPIFVCGAPNSDGPTTELLTIPNNLGGAPVTDWIDSAVNTRRDQISNALGHYVQSVTNAINNPRWSKYEAAGVATLCAELVTPQSATRLKAYYDWATAAIPPGRGPAFQITSNFNVEQFVMYNSGDAPMLANANALRLEVDLLARGGEYNNFDSVFKAPANDLDAAKASFAAGLMKSRLGMQHIDLYNRVTVSTPARGAAGELINSAIIRGGYNNNQFDGSAKLELTMLSKLIGLGICDTESGAGPGMLPTPADSYDWFNIRAGGANGGYALIIDPAGRGTWVDAMSEVSDKVNRDYFATLASSPLFSRDDIPLAAPNGKGDPINPLFASLSKALRTALTETTSQGVKLNIVSSIAEVPIRMKEAMKGNLPIFNELFKMIAKKGNFLKSLVSIDVGLDRADWSAYTRYDVAIPGVHGGTLLCKKRSHKEGKAWYTAFLDKITQACESMCSTIESVMNELNDAPLYLELSENSIVEYKNRSGKLPLMPLSTITTALQPSYKQNMAAAAAAAVPADKWSDGQGNLQPRRAPDFGYPGFSTGDPRFMYNYGTRLLLHDYKVKPLIEHMPGVADIIKTYNAASHGGKKMEEKTTGEFMAKFVELLRYAHSIRIFSGLVGADRAIIDDTKKDQGNLRNHLTYQQTQQLSTVIELTSSSDKNIGFTAIASHVDKSNTSPSINRESSIIYNILDLNISPVNVHAMQKEIPLANLYNYAYTFDSFVSQIVQSSYNGEGDGHQDFTIGEDPYKDTDVEQPVQKTTHEILSALCKNPYIRVPKATFYGNLQQLLSGHSSIDMYGYPKFITDQLWNKALLQDTVLDAGNNVGRRNDRQADGRWSSAIDRQIVMRRHLKRPGIPGMGAMAYPDDKIKYLDSDGKVESADVANNCRKYLGELGRLRFDSKFARNLFFLSNVHRIIMHKIKEELSTIPYPVASGPSITNRRITDYRDGETYAELAID